MMHQVIDAIGTAEARFAKSAFVFRHRPQSTNLGVRGSNPFGRAKLRFDSEQNSRRVRSACASYLACCRVICRSITGRTSTSTAPDSSAWSNWAIGSRIAPHLMSIELADRTAPFRPESQGQGSVRMKARRSTPLPIASPLQAASAWSFRRSIRSCLAHHAMPLDA